MADPNAPPSPDDTLPPEYQPDPFPAATPAIDPNDVAYQAEQALAPGGAVEQAKAAQAKLAAAEAALEADPKVRIALAIDKVRAVLDEVAPLLEAVPGPIGDAVRVVKADADLADDLLAKIGL